MIIAVVAVGLHTLPTTAIIIMSTAHRYLQQKSEKLSFLASVPPQVVPEVAQSAYNRDFRPMHVSWCVKNVLVRTLREIRGFPGTNIVFFSAI